ncbi:MAG: 4-hydroxy-tetrahydrodipicolinate synthase [Peptococcaceae bacterium]|nr:4-hydroxy-tetrahydrodipicolinate synthase [Peptococcaceae bacterium]
MVSNFGQVITAMVTPFDNKQSINFAQARKLAAHLTQNGTDGLVVSGTTGESPALSKDEKIELFNNVVDEVGGNASIIAGTGSNSTADSITMTKAVEKIGVNGVLVVAPYYNKPTQEGLFQHFKAIAESTDLPVMVYNIPGRSVVNILPETVARLAEIKNVVAIKESSGNMDQISEYKRCLPDDFDIYSGDDSMTLPMLALGARGVVSVSSHLVGVRIKEMINAYASSNAALALQIHLELMPLFKGLFITTSPAPIKAALNMTGWQVGGLRLPLVDVTDTERAFIGSLLQSMKLLGKP